MENGFNGLRIKGIITRLSAGIPVKIALKPTVKPAFPTEFPE